MLFLFGIGVNRAKSMALLTVLNKFKQLYDSNAAVKEVLPSLYQEHPEFYAKMSIQTLAKSMHAVIKKHDLPRLMYHAFDELPNVVITPHEAYQRLIKKEIELVPLSEMKGKVSASMILPYPPGIPVIMPGEQITDSSEIILDFLVTLDDISEALPGFSTDIHGVIIGADGKSYVQVIKENCLPSKNKIT
jgi:lysine decarboxylase